MGWLGLAADEGALRDGTGNGAFGPYYQMQRLENYRRVWPILQTPPLHPPARPPT